MKYILYTVAIILSGSYLLLTALYVSPINPIKTRINAHNYIIGKFFYQDWGLFAPNPVSSNSEVHVQCISSNQSTQMTNISRGLWERHRQNRISPYDRLGRSVGNYTHQVFSISRPEAIARAECNKNALSENCEKSKKMRKDGIEAAIQGLRRVAASYCGDQSYVTEEKFDQAQILVSSQAVQPWSKRHQAPVEALFVDLGKHKLPKVQAPGIWR